MKRKQAVGIAMAAVVLGAGVLGAGYAAGGTEREPAYSSSIQVKDQDREERGERREQAGERHEERGEAGRLAALAKIDATQAVSAALAQVPGTVLKTELDNENGNLVYSVEIRTSKNEIKDVKVDAGNGAVLHVGAGEGEDEEDS
jgi:uncharacterized membrane protein YkoI